MAVQQLARWIERLHQYNVYIQHSSGKLHGNTDSLSRCPCGEGRICTKAEQNGGQGILLLQAQPVDIASSHEKDLTYSLILQWLKKWERLPKSTTWSEGPESKAYWLLFEHLFMKKGLLIIKSKTADEALVVPRSIQEQVLRSVYNSTTGGHFGFKKTVGKLKQRYFWIGQAADGVIWCARCTECNARKGPSRRTVAPRPKCSIWTTCDRHSRSSAHYHTRESLHRGDLLLH